MCPSCLISSSCRAEISGLRVRKSLENRFQCMTWNQNSSADSDAGHLSSCHCLISRNLANPQDLCDLAHRKNGRSVGVVGHPFHSLSCSQVIERSGGNAFVLDSSFFHPLIIKRAFQEQKPESSETFFSKLLDFRPQRNKIGCGLQELCRKQNHKLRSTTLNGLARMLTFRGNVSEDRGPIVPGRMLQGSDRNDKFSIPPNHTRSCRCEVWGL